MRAWGTLLCMVACFVTLSQAEVVEVASAADLVAKLAVAEPNSNIEVKLTDHITLEADISLDNITSLAIWGDCATPPANATDPKPGMCAIDMGTYTIVPKILKTETGIIDPANDWVQLYFDNVAISYSGGLKWELKATTLWLVDSSVTGYQEMQLNNGSLYIIDSTVDNMPLGMGISLSGGSNPDVASESSALFVGATLNVDKFPNIQLLDPADTTGYLVIHDSTFNGTTDAKISYSVADNTTQTLVVLSDSEGLAFYDNLAGADATPEPFSTDKVADWTYHEKNVDFLTSLVQDEAPGAAKALDPFGTGSGTTAPPDAVSSDPGSPPKGSSSTPPGTPSVQSPPSSAAVKPAMAVAASILLLLALV